MELQKKADVGKSIKQADDLPVYEAEIIDEEEEKTKIELKNARPPARKLAYKIGKAAGSIIASLAFLNEIRSAFKMKSTPAGDMGRGGGRGARRRKRRNRRII